MNIEPQAGYADIPSLKRFPIDWRTQCIPHAARKYQIMAAESSNDEAVDSILVHESEKVLLPKRRRS
jgi:hypothetical protein